MLKALREWWTGRYESPPLRLMDSEEAIAWADGRRCDACGQPMYRWDGMLITNSTDRGLSAIHMNPCPVGDEE